VIKTKSAKLLWKATAFLLVLLMLPAQLLAAGGRADRKETDLRTLSTWPEGPSISARSAYLIELNSGEVLFAQNENEKRYPASITKVMTALIAIESCSLDEMVTFSHKAVTDIESGGGSPEFKEGEQLTVEQCLYALLLDSVNECGYALAEHISGSVEAFAEKMNERAKELGCTKTFFQNPHGLNDPEHTTTAHDMALIFWACLQNRIFYTIDSTLSYSIPATAKNPDGYNFTMHHKMMNPDSEYYNESVKAGKTGYTSLARNTLLTYAEKDGVELLAVVMKADGSENLYKDTKRLLTYGFDKFQLADLTENAASFCANLSSAYPVAASAGEVKAYLPADGASGITTNFEEFTNWEQTGIVGSLVFSIGTDVIAKSDVTIDLEELKTLREQEAAAQQTTAEETEEDQTQDKAQKEKKEKGESKWFKKVIFVILGLIALVAIYWVIIQIIKKQRRKKRRRKQAEAYMRQKYGRRY